MYVAGNRYPSREGAWLGTPKSEKFLASFSNSDTGILVASDNNLKTELRRSPSRIMTLFEMVFAGSTKYEIAVTEEIFAGTRYVPGKKVGFSA